SRSELRLQSRDRVQELRLLGDPHRLRLAERGGAYGPELSQTLKGEAQVPLALAQVRSESDVDGLQRGSIPRIRNEIRWRAREEESWGLLSPRCRARGGLVGRRGAAAAAGCPTPTGGSASRRASAGARGRAHQPRRVRAGTRPLPVRSRRRSRQVRRRREA